MIDKSNWMKLEGFVPDPVLDWVKKGEWVLKIGELKFDPGGHLPEFALEAMETNVGKYGLDQEGGIITPKTGKRPEHTIGLPFPEIDLNDPEAAVKIIQNNHFWAFLTGDLKLPFFVTWMGRGGG